MNLLNIKIIKKLGKILNNEFIRKDTHIYTYTYSCMMLNYNLMEVKDKALAHKIFMSCILLAQLVVVEL